MTEQEIKERLEAIILSQENVLAELNFLIDSFPEAREKYAQLSGIVENIKNINLSESTDNIIEKLEEYGQLISELNSNIGKNLNLFNFIETNQNENISVEDYLVTVYDAEFNPTSITTSIDSENKKLNLTSRFFPEDLYYIKVSQNMDTTKLFPDVSFTFYKIESINNNATKVILNVDDESIIADIVNNNRLNDSILYVNEKTKYYVVRYGGVIINGSKKLVLYMFPNISETITSVSFHKNLFDDIVMEMNFSDYDMQDVSDFYYGDAERDLQTGEMIIYGRDNEPKHMFTFSIEGNKELRTRNG